MTGAPDPYVEAEQVLRLALADDEPAVADRFNAVMHRGGASEAYDVALCLAATMVGDDVAAGAWTLEFPGIDEAGYDARWVARFVSAYVNADPSLGNALVESALADGQLARCLATLAGSAVATLRRRAA